ncbi:MAG: [protein-PII] uridylyltransferase [Betaproteobacteria bacterium HGW-Betaproteobacteria-11]|nr:MAG: [protein-PII] uridylyltransferase [Betaproteobacteria bacterium HGW-Betaproteobacteria-11]
MDNLTELASILRRRLVAERQQITTRWQTNHGGRVLLTAHARCVDEILRELWSALAMPDDYVLVAVGGYGRGELYPASDVDLLILRPATAEMDSAAQLEQFISLAWDSGLEIGHSVRTIDECLYQAERDITVQTALLEARHLIGAPALFRQFSESFTAALDPAAFFRAKQLEQAERYAKYHDTPFSLEPNCKESPGGLRDLQVILWVARTARLGDDWKALAQNGLITTIEARQLERVERRLRELRIALHLLAGRREDRLLFDHQEKLAAALGVVASDAKRASEVLMQHYYQNAKLITQLNLLALQLLADRLLPARSGATLLIDAHFQSFRGQLDVRADDTFERHPSALLQCFLLQMQRSELSGMTPRTLRALWRARRLINARFRADLQNRVLFIALFKQRHLIHALRRMDQFDILGRYLPAFGRIVGQMQHDLFHVYTVDQHILQVMRNLRRFAMAEFAHEYPFCSRLMAGLEKPWLLYLGALFHDIAKGRGGDHSRLGMTDAEEFCRAHGLSDEETGLVVFLVGEHLTMSQVAQKQDLSNPEVIRAFARRIGDMQRLTLLYLFTVADIRGTSPKVWNVWKGKLLEDLFRMTARLLAGDTVPQLAGVAERQEGARRILRLHGLRPGVEDALWEHLDTAYFLRHDSDEVAWQTRALYYRPEGDAPVVRARLNPIGEGLQVMIYSRDQPLLFARLCGFFACLGYTIVDARIHTTRHGYALDSFVVFATTEDPGYRDMIALIEHDLAEQLAQQAPLPAIPGGRLSRQVRHFPMTPEVDIRPDERGEQYLMGISAIDRPGLLYVIARVLGEHDIRLHTAKIATLGERVEDVFLISGEELTQTASLVRLEQDLLAALQI